MGPMTSAAAVSCVGSLRSRLLQRWPVALSDVEVLTLGLACTAAHSDAVLELVCSRALAPIAKRDCAELALNPEELTQLLALVATRTTTATVVLNTEFVARRKKVEAALVCTLAETSGAKLWLRPCVQMTTLFSFHTTTPPFATLDALFGSVVRADVRRAEDLHFAELEEPMDVMTLTELVEAVARVALS